MLIDNPSPFFASVVACPIGKERLSFVGDGLRAPSGLSYPNGDLRVGLEFSDQWRKGQDDYERYHERWMQGDERSYVETDDESRDVYAALLMSGSVLDIGGAPGIVAQQANLDIASYVCLDAQVCKWRDIANSAFARHYAHCAKACRAPAFAEFLPISASTFDYVHMRSCIDHFANPLLALKESFRVLKPSGRLVVGLSLEGAYKKGQGGLLQSLKIAVKRTDFARELYERFFDHHTFHPTREALIALLNRADFSVEKEVWAEAYHNVLFVRARKHHAPGEAHS